jgi:hypothetical protein
MMSFPTGQSSGEEPAFCGRLKNICHPELTVFVTKDLSEPREVLALFASIIIARLARIHILMRKLSITTLLFVGVLLTACTPRDVLSRRLATDLIAASDAFRTPQRFLLQTGVISNKEYSSSEYLTLQHHGWISANTVSCPPALAPSPCWDILLTPSGVETVRSLVSADEAAKPSIEIPVARRTLDGVTGVSKQANTANVEFTWKWAPINEVGAALYSSDLRYRSVVGFREFDDGWRVVQNTPHPTQGLDDALKSAEPAP